MTQTELEFSSDPDVVKARAGCSLEPLPRALLRLLPPHSYIAKPELLAVFHNRTKRKNFSRSMVVIRRALKKETWEVLKIRDRDDYYLGPLQLAEYGLPQMNQEQAIEASRTIPGLTDAQRQAIAYEYYRIYYAYESEATHVLKLLLRPQEQALFNLLWAKVKTSGFGEESLMTTKEIGQKLYFASVDSERSTIRQLVHYINAHFQEKKIHFEILNARNNGYYLTYLE